MAQPTEVSPSARQRRAKIVATLGPATSTIEQVCALAEAGMDVARVNLAHGTHAEHRRLCQLVHTAGDELGRTLGVMADIAGPKMRLGAFEGGSARLEVGEAFVITTVQCVGTPARASTGYSALPDDVKPGDGILLDDGNIRLKVVAVDGTEVRTEVVEGGTVSDHKGINLPGVAVSAPPLSDEDVDALRNVIDAGVDLVALSFVRHAADATAVRDVMDRPVPVIAKIEKPEVLGILPAIVKAFDGIMVARGDLGVEAPLEWVPLIQKRAVSLARAHAKPVIVATQMLESMITHSRPTRAEASDVANAILDGTDAVMLSAETGVGAYPVAAVATMDRIIQAAESDPTTGYPAVASEEGGVPDAVASAAVALADRVGACALVAFTETGRTAQRLAARRIGIPILACSPNPAIHRQLALTWSVAGLHVPPVSQTDEMVAAVDAALQRDGLGAPGDLVVIVAATPVGGDARTNMVRVHEVGGT